MLGSELCHRIERIKVRFGDLEVRCGIDSITGLAVLPLDAGDDENADPRKGGLVISLLVRESDRGGSRAGD